MKNLISISFIFVLTGCTGGFIGVALESMTVSKVDGYFDLDEKQRDHLRADVKKDIQNVKQQLLPEVASSLRKLEKQIQTDSKSPPDLAKVFIDYENYLKRLMQQMEGTSLRLVQTLNDEQFEHFSRKVLSNIKETEEKTATPAKALKHSVKLYEKYLEFWVGDISSDQREQIEGFLKRHPYPWVLQGQNKRQLLARFMDSKDSPEKMQIYLHEFLQDYQSVRLEGFQQALKNHEQAFQTFLLQTFWQSLSKGQRQEMKSSLLARAERIEGFVREN